MTTMWATVTIATLCIIINNTGVVNGSYCNIFDLWSGWSACSTSCGGGYRERHCGGTVDRARCNVQCYNGGNFLNDKCHCPAGTTQKCCEDILECASNPCQNGGTCNEMINMYNCTCPPRYIGDNCELDLFSNHDYECRPGGHCYIVFELELSWESAKKFCEARQGYLVIPNDLSEQMYLENFLQAMLDRYPAGLFWIGGTKYSSDTPKWVVSQQISVNRWPLGVPDAVAGTQCMVIDSQYQFEWSTRLCDQKIAFICEETIPYQIVG